MRLSSNLSFSTLCLIALATSACRTTNNSAELDFIGGDQATSENFPATVYIPGCTAVKVADTMFMTAAHCVVDDNLMMLEDDYAAGATLKIKHGALLGDAANHPVTVANTYIHPSYAQAVNASEGKGLSANQFTKVVDLAVISVKEATPSIATATVRYATLTNASTVAVGGYGCENDPFSDPTIMVAEGDNDDDGLKQRRLMWASTKVTNIDGTVVEFPKGQLRDKQISFCDGDSGGPVYLDSRKDKKNTKTIFKTLVGINAFRSFNKNNFTRLDDGGSYKVATCVKAALRGKFPDESMGSFPVLCAK